MADRRLDALGAAVDSAARLLDRHDQQVAADRYVSLPSRTDHRGDQLRPGRVRDVVDVEAAEIADEQLVALEREIGIREVERRPRAVRRRRGCGRCSGGGGLLVRVLRSFGLGRLPRRRLGIEEAWRLRQAGDELQVVSGDAWILQPGLQADTRILRRLLLGAGDRYAEQHRGKSTDSTDR